MRRDRLGRRIGRNAWREFVWDQWSCAHHAWWLRCESVTSLWDTEVAEFKLTDPEPRFREFLVGLSDQWREFARPAAAA